jgi:general nucleoside transport system permease protein
MSEIASSSSTRRKQFPFAIRFEPRLVEPPRWYPFAISFGAILFALIIGGVVIAFSGGDPLRSYAHIARASFGNLGVFSDTIVKATPLILVGLACSVAFRMRLWNIGAEGQFFLGAFGASAVVLLPILPGSWPGLCGALCLAF